MISQVEHFIQNLEKKDKIINYLKHVYKVEVGEDVDIPEGYINKLSIKEAESMNVINIPKERKIVFETFDEKVESLNLPDPNDKNMKSKIQKLRKQGDTEYLIRYLDLSNYKDKGINKEGLKKVSEGLKVLKSVEVLDLSNNDLDDSFTAEILDLLSNDALKRINLKHNNLGKIAGKKIYQLLKNLKQLEFFDISYNPLCQDELVCSNICLSLRVHEKLFHLGIGDCSRDGAVRALYLRKNLRSLSLEDNKYKNKTWDYLSRVLIDKKIYLAELSLKFSNIDIIGSVAIEKIIKLNKTIIHLNLYSCNLSDYSGSKIIEAMEFNNTLVELNLGFNNLGSLTCEAINKKIGLNKTVIKLDISKNSKITIDNFDLILQGLINSQSIISLGDLTEIKIGVKQKEHALQILKMNIEYSMKEGKDILLNTSQKEMFMKSSLEMNNLTQSSFTKQGYNVKEKENDDNLSKYKSTILKNVSNKEKEAEVKNNENNELNNLLNEYNFSFSPNEENIGSLFVFPQN